MQQILVDMKGIEKSFPGVHALKQCQFELRSGEVHALVGENGAGKSTLMKILTGVYQKDQGTILYKGAEVNITNTKMAQEMGISIIHQELNLMPDLTVAQNIFIGREPSIAWGLFLDEKKINRDAEQILQSMNLDLSPTTLVSELSVAKQQMVEIAKALSFDAEVLIMDEPTAALTDSEIEELFRIILRLRAKGAGIIYISHRMEELMQITDRITVMRDGAYIDTVETKDTSIDQIVSMMVGRQIYHTAQPQVNQQYDEVVLEVKHLNQGRKLKDIHFTLKKGEILGFAGLMGAGRTEVARAIFGADPIDSGEIYINGQKVKIEHPHDAVKQGIGYLSEDRKLLGLMVEMDVKTNIAVASYKDFMRMGGLMMLDKKIEKAAHQYVDTLDIRTPSIHQTVKYLSGGNQQKVVIGKWLTRNCDILIFDEPTRGIDVGAKDEIYKLLNKLAEEGKSIIMISSELPEILRMSHRIVVMCEGRITGILPNTDVQSETIMNLATKRGD